MKVLITTEWYEPVVNGVVTSVLNLREELTRQGHEVRVLTLGMNHIRPPFHQLIQIRVTHTQGQSGIGINLPHA